MIRDLLRTDVPDLAELNKLFWDEKHKSNLKKMYTLFDKLHDDSPYILLGCFSPSNRLVGFVMGIVCQELYGECEPFLLLENMVVDTKIRRAGIGKRLVLELEKRAVLKGCRQIILVTETARTSACAFYEAMGFSKDNAGYKKKVGVGTSNAKADQ